MVSETSANPTGVLFWVPLKITSSILAPRSVRVDCSPRTQRMASQMLLFPLPFGPTMAVIPSSKPIFILSGNDLNPWISRFFKYTGADNSISLKLPVRMAAVYILSGTKPHFNNLGPE